MKSLVIGKYDGVVPFSSNDSEMAPRQRKKKEYPPQQVLGLKIVGRILKAARLNTENADNSTVRGWLAFLKASTGNKWNIADLQRYESAGEINTAMNPKTGQPFGNLKVVNPEYIKDVAGFTSYTYEFLAALASGLVEIKEEPIADAIDRAEEKIGDRNQFLAAARGWKLDEEDLLMAKKGLLKGNHFLLSAFLGYTLNETIPPNRILDMAIAQLAKEINSGVAEDNGN